MPGEYEHKTIKPSESFAKSMRSFSEVSRKSKLRKLVNNIIDILEFSQEEEDEIAKKLLKLFADGRLNWREL